MAIGVEFSREIAVDLVQAHLIGNALRGDVVERRAIDPVGDHGEDGVVLHGDQENCRLIIG